MLFCLVHNVTLPTENSFAYSEGQITLLLSDICMHIYMNIYN